MIAFTTCPITAQIITVSHFFFMATIMMNMLALRAGNNGYFAGILSVTIMRKYIQPTAGKNQKWNQKHSRYFAKRINHRYKYTICWGINKSI